MNAYRAGLQALHDASTDEARRNFEEALQRDEYFAAAHLGYVMASADLAPTREHMRRASLGRGLLDARQRRMLDALDPWLHDDIRASIERLRAGVREDPNDPDLRYQLERLLFYAGDYAEAEHAGDEALRVDSSSAAALRVKATALVFQDRTEEAIQEYRDCLSMSPAATSCIHDWIEVQAGDGGCDVIEGLARRLISLQPNTAWGYYYLANAVIEQSPDAAGLLLQQYVAHWLPAQREAQTSHMLALLDLVQGHFREARSALAEWQRTMSPTIRQQWNADADMESARLAAAIGDTQELATIGERIVREHAAWHPTTMADVRILGWGALYRAGRLSRASFRELRAAWLDAEERQHSASPRAVGRPRGYRWIVAFAEPAVDEVDAREALDVLPQYEPLPNALVRAPPQDEPIGRVYLLAGAGHEASAAHYLGRAARACTLAAMPIPELTAREELGRLYERMGDIRQACEAYRSVLRWWGHSSPRAGAAERARIRARALRCDR